LSKGKLPTYVLPCIPPLAVFIALGLDGYVTQGRLHLFRAGAWSGAALFASFALIIFLAQTGVTGKALWSEKETWKWVVTAIVSTVAALQLWQSPRLDTTVHRFALFGCSMAGLMVALNAVLPARTIDSKMPGDFLQKNAAYITSDTMLFSDDLMIHAVNWYYKRDDVYMTGAGESKHGLSFADAKGRLIEGEALKQFINENLGTAPMVVIHHSDALKYISRLMPDNAVEQSQGRFVMWVIPAATSTLAK